MSASKQTSVGLVSFDSLGDSLIYITLADNLARNHFVATLYGAVGHQLAAWLPHLDLKPYPSEAEYAGLAQEHDLVLVSPPSGMRKRFLEQPAYLEWARSQWILLCQKAPKDWQFDHKSRLDRLNLDQSNKLLPLLESGHSIRFREFGDDSMLGITLTFMNQKWKLKDVNKHVQLSPPAGLEHRKHKRRIVVSPDSAGPAEKEWPARKFMQLCEQLLRLGFEPVIVVAPRNHQHWSAIISGRYELPIFKSIDSLAAYLYESALVVCNDSGNGHLASFLNVPVVTIYKKRNRLYHWRPDWRSAVVVTPYLSMSNISKTIWKLFTPVNRVTKAVVKTLKESDFND